MTKLTDKEFKAYLSEAHRKISAVLDITKEKDINYGHQLVVELCQAKLTLNIYNGKKGLTYVFSGDSALEKKVRELLGEGKPSYGSKNGFADYDDGLAHAADADALPRGKWAGSDESGKGDFFGPLVVSAVVVDDSTAAKLAAAGVKDCKLLSDKKILELEETIKANVIDFSVLELKPKFYNLRYKQVLDQGGKLNQLLGFGHVAALSQVLERNADCHAALIDQFTTSTVNVRELSKRFPQCIVKQQPKAESNLAVAAASVLARARFLRTMAELAQAAGEAALPKGGGESATACARRLSAKLGKAELVNYVKLHFANYSRI
ncbi:MAG: ribonuclease HIII [Phascolarctobacterium sp.]|nr:ribonuclease HIII [Phascolarctobacterium sp.]